ncbi:hypothetical protein Tsubulata_047051 [Turnera subulata]|uniref:DUF8040 domain-containing protein n=1 Tax=Turnera subulata TaxID=218843 RepID=A0A9Q0G5U2_9ROSI|nr:hypothetical protein Tsubulata_047051 [Turnera subulata]
MFPECFIQLCEDLKGRGKLAGSKFLTVQEQVGIFLYIICQNERQRVTGDRFQHSLETISTHFKKVLYAVFSLAKHIIVPPSFDETLPEIRNNPKYYPFFKNCVGAIDVTHISACVPTDHVTPRIFII